MSIVLFSRPIHSGKTTALLQCCDGQKDIQGILMPDIDGSRKILDIGTKEIFDIQCADPVHTTEQITTVGKFHFYTAAFEKANRILLDASKLDPEWLIIDEAGKLELEGKGFYEALRKIIPLYDKAGKSKLVITVRDFLCEDVIRLFRISNYSIAQEAEELF
jgi:nucleoside-triphosphatase